MRLMRKAIRLIYIDYLMKYSIFVKILTLFRKSVSIKNYRIDVIRPIKPVYADSQKKYLRFNLMMSSLKAAGMYAGAMTALKFFMTLQEVFEDAEFRILVVGNVFNEKDVFIPEGFKLLLSGEENVKKGVINLTGKDRALTVHEHDIFISTNWYSAYVANDLIRDVREKKPILFSKLIYLIQDYEPYFKPWSSEFMLAQSTYNLEIDTIAIINSEQLFDYLHNMNHFFYREFIYKPRLNSVLREYLFENREYEERKNRILIYGRYFSKRNAFEIILGALEEWFSKDIEAKKWEVISLGNDFGTIKTENGLFIKSLGKLSLKDYAKIMLESKIGISLMVSPHPSYPPLEMSTFGMKTITNNFANKKLNDFNENIIALENCTPRTLSEELLKLTTDKYDIYKAVYESDYLESDNSFWHNVCHELKSEFIINKQEDF